jgi:hypothetical protein
LLQGAANSQPLWDRFGPVAPHYAAVSGFGAGRVGGLVSAAGTVPGFFFKIMNIVGDLIIPLAGRVFPFSNRCWDGSFFP